MKDLYEFKTNTIWIKEYPIHYAGTRFNSRMTIIRLSNGNLFIHSPCEIDEQTKIAIEKLGKPARHNVENSLLVNNRFPRTSGYSPDVNFSKKDNRISSCPVLPGAHVSATATARPIP